MIIHSHLIYAIVHLYLKKLKINPHEMINALKKIRN